MKAIKRNVIFRYMDNIIDPLKPHICANSPL